MSTYTEAKRQAYLRNKEKIAEKEKDKKRWLTYHAEHKEEVSARRKERRLKKELPPIDEDKVRRYYELIEEAKALKAEATKKKIRDTALAKRIARTAPPPPPKPEGEGPGLKPAPEGGIEDSPDE